MHSIGGLHGDVFFALFQSHWPRFWPLRGKGHHNQEDRFKRYLKGEKLIDAFGSRIVTELPYECEAGRQSIDYVLLPPEHPYVRRDSPFSGKKPHVSEVLATCEFKGPARPTLWEFNFGSLPQPNWRNWYNKGGKSGLVPDVSKQLDRASFYPRAEHYCAWTAMLSDPRSKAKREFGSSLDSLSREVRRDLDLPDGAIATFRTCRFEKIDSNMVMFLWRVTAL
jgi:hypothetical protein